MQHNNTLAPRAKQTLADWHRFVETHDRALLETLLADTIVFRSPFLYAPIPGPPATVLILTTVIQIFENFRYHREFVAGPHDVVLEFSGNVGEWQLKGVDLIKFDQAGRMTDFEVMIRPMKALQALSSEMSARIGPQLAKYKQPAPQVG